MPNPPKGQSTQTTPQQRSEQLRQALAEREAAKAIRSAPPPKQSDADSAKALDTFEAAVVPAAAVALAGRDLEDRVTVGEEFTGEQNPNEDQQNQADEVGNLLDDDKDDQGQQSRLTGEEEEEDEQSPFAFVNPGREKVAELTGGLISDSNQPGQHEGDARGDGGMRDRIGAGKVDVAQAVNAKGYTEEQSSLEGGELAALISGDVSGLLGARNAALTEELDVMTGLLSNVANTTTSKTSVASGGGNDLLGQAVREVYGEPAKDPDAGKSTNVSVISKGQAGLPGSNAEYWDNDTGEVVQADQVTQGGKVAADGEMTKTGDFNKNDSDKIDGGGTKTGFNIFGSIGTALADWANSDEDAAADKASADAKAKREAADAERAEDEAKQNEEAAKAKAEKKAEDERKADEARKRQEEEDAKEAGGGAKMSGDPDDPDGNLGGPPTEAELAFRQHLYDSTGYKGAGAGQRGGEVDPADDSTSTGIRVAPTGIAAQGKENLIGQPNDPDLALGGGGGGNGPGNLPGDQGNIDPGEENDTGPFTSEQRGGNPGDIDTGVGGAPLARPDNSGDEDDDSSSVVKSAAFRFDHTKEVRAAAKSAFDDDDD